MFNFFEDILKKALVKRMEGYLSLHELRPFPDYPFVAQDKKGFSDGLAKWSLMTANNINISEHEGNIKFPKETSDQTLIHWKNEYVRENLDERGGALSEG